MWGGVLNVTRNLAREAASPWGFPPDAKALLEMHARWVIAMPWLLRAHLEGISPKPQLENLLPPDELEYLLEASQPCLRCAQVATGCFLKVVTSCTKPLFSILEALRS